MKFYNPLQYNTELECSQLRSQVETAENSFIEM